MPGSEHHTFGRAGGRRLEESSRGGDRDERHHQRTALNGAVAVDLLQISANAAPIISMRMADKNIESRDHLYPGSR